MAGTKLKLTEKRFIVRLLAVYETPSEIVPIVKEKFDVEISKQGVAFYDPTTIAGNELSEELKTLFFETRKQFEEAEILPLSKKIVRIKKLSKYVQSFENNQNYIGAAQIIEQIAKEEGDAFSNRRQIDIKNVSKLSDEELLAIVGSESES